MKKWLGNILVLIISTGICLVILEMLVRVLFPTYDPAAMVKFYYNEDGVLLGEKNSLSHQWIRAGEFNVQIRINQYGFRDVKDLQHSTEHDLFVVGDSFSFGHGVEEDERYSNLLESMLPVPVYNISIPTDLNGYEKLVKYAQQHGATIHHLLIGICMENDLQHYTIETTSAVNASTTSAPQTPSQTEPYYNRVNYGAFLRIKVFLADQLALYNMLIGTIHQNRFLKNIAVRTGVMDKTVDGINRFQYSEDILRQTCEKLLSLKTICQIPRVTLVMIPSRGLWLGDNQDVERKTHKTFVAILEEEGFQVIDLLLFFEEGGEPLQYHFASDGHWNPKGHYKAAEVIAAQIGQVSQHTQAILRTEVKEAQ